MTIPECVIDLSGSNDGSISPLQVNTCDDINKQLIVRPTSTALRSIGLGMIKMQYFENVSKLCPTVTIQENDLKKREDLWQTVWIDEPKGPFNYQFRHVLESRFEKSYRCVMPRSRLCHNSGKMTRNTWFHHMERGHFRIHENWKAILKKNNNCELGNVFEIFCLLCPEKKRRKCIPLRPSNFISHVKRNHNLFLPYIEYLSYFQRCFICNDRTKSLAQNISHRQFCLSSVLKDPNQVGTEHFNNCFKTQRCVFTQSLESGSNRQSIFHSKMKLSDISKCSSLYLWLQLKKNGIQNPSQLLRNGLNARSFTPNASLVALRHSFAANRIFMNCTVNLSNRSIPGSNIDKNLMNKFLIPVPFAINNDIQSKETYVRWKKSIQPSQLKILTNSPWYCEICNAMMKSGRTAFCHLKMCHPTVAFNESICKSCSKKFLTSDGYNNHFKGLIRCPVTRRCVICNLTLSINDIYEHISLKHREDFHSLIEHKTCLICKENVDNLTNHLFDIHGMVNSIQGQPNVGKINFRNGSFFNCSKCALTYFTEVELRNHIILNDHYFECVDCPSLRFSLSWELLLHMCVAHRSGAVSNKIRCDLCIKTEQGQFAMYSDLVIHFIGVHLRPCSVLLRDINDNDNDDCML